MTSIAILVGNTDYQNLSKLTCCRDDVIAIGELLAATEKYAEISVIENAEADALKLNLRAVIDKFPRPKELFFYFTGHGFLSSKGDFFHCATNFESGHPNETGISTEELHTLLRLADAELIVKVIDACNSGTLLIKSDSNWLQQTKTGFKNLIQIASSLDSQNSLTGNPLSIFTENFRDAALRKPEGAVFYTDIINSLRDQFIDNNAQTPFFVLQHTGREQFVDDARRLDGLRKMIEERKAAVAVQTQVTPAQPAITLLDRLRAADAKVVKREVMETFVANVFDTLIEKISTNEFADFFDLEIKEHDNFNEPTAENFIIRVMSNEKRPDDFVRAEYSRRLRTRNPLVSLMPQQHLDDDMYQETSFLSLNCEMVRTQLRIMFTPKFMNLQRILLVVTCAPSLDHCYIFEIATQHRLQDFGKFSIDGLETSRRWWKLNWGDSPNGVVAQISNKFVETACNQLESAEKRLSKDA